MQRPSANCRRLLLGRRKDPGSGGKNKSQIRMIRGLWHSRQHGTSCGRSSGGRPAPKPHHATPIPLSLCPTHAKPFQPAWVSSESLADDSIYAADQTREHTHTRGLGMAQKHAGDSSGCIEQEARLCTRVGKHRYMDSTVRISASCKKRILRNFVQHQGFDPLHVQQHLPARPRADSAHPFPLVLQTVPVVDPDRLPLEPASHVGKLCNCPKGPRLVHRNCLLCLPAGRHHEPANTHGHTLLNQATIS